MNDTTQKAPQTEDEVESLSIGALIAGRVFADFQQATDFVSFYRLFKSVFAHYAEEATEHRAHRCHGYSVAYSLTVLLMEALVKAQVLAGEGVGFATMRSEFMAILEAQFRLFAVLHAYPMPKKFAAELRADFEKDTQAGRPSRLH